MPPATVSLSYLNVFWLVHVISELPLGIQAFLSPDVIPLAQKTGSTLLLIQARKRAMAIQLLLFHGIVSAIYMRLPDGIVTFQLPPVLLDLFPWLGMYRFTIWIAALHGCIALLITAWWQATLPQVQAITAQAKAA
ncbi:hypothetical protein MNAN1_001190 [Malassezia nana]|uniref:Uncharacterized protein n=1 Tax=Malassezia nana TaxID=180528 RepID=A0AAF0J2Z9_9BASI|nr:hypothetical protein MNAN1_001190 [Malassezia nana]